MTGEGVAAIGAVAIVIATAALLFTMASIIRTMKVMRRAVEDVHDETVPLLVDVHSGVVQTNHELKRVDGLIDRAESIGASVDSTSKLTYKLLSGPAVKFMALGAGGARALRQLRRRKS